MSFLNGLKPKPFREINRYDFLRVAKIAFAVLGVFGIATMLYLDQPYRLTYNNTWSMPRGLWYYKISDDDSFHIGERVVTHYRAPKWIADRPWSEKLHRRLLKDVRGVPGDHLEISHGVIRNCGPTAKDLCPIVATRMAWDSRKHPLFFQSLPKVIPPDHYLLIGENPLSLDSRYLGLFSANSIIAVAHPLLTWKIPARAKDALGYQVPASKLPLPKGYWDIDNSQWAVIPQDTVFPDAASLIGWSYYDTNGKSHLIQSRNELPDLANEQTETTPSS